MRTMVSSSSNGLQVLEYRDVLPTSRVRVRIIRFSALVFRNVETVLNHAFTVLLVTKGHNEMTQKLKDRSYLFELKYSLNRQFG